MQRLTALVMAAYTVFLAGYVLWCPPASYADWRGLFTGPFVRLATMLFFLALLYHAWVGVRDIIMDYIKPTGLRLSLETLVLLTVAGYLAWAIQILWR
jgi:succinate dehydrogenase / fumarate reductase membrane anchor subunit